MQSSVAHVTISNKGIIQSCNDKVLTVFGYKPSELIGKKVNVLMPEPHRSLHDNYLEKYSKTGFMNVMGRHRNFTGVTKVHHIR